MQAGHASPAHSAVITLSGVPAGVQFSDVLCAIGVKESEVIGKSYICSGALVNCSGLGGTWFVQMEEQNAEALVKRHGGNVTMGKAQVLIEPLIAEVTGSRLTRPTKNKSLGIAKLRAYKDFQDSLTEDRARIFGK